MPGFLFAKNVEILKESYKILLTYHPMGGIIKVVKGT